MVFMGDSTTRRLVFHAIYLMMDSNQKLQLDKKTHTLAHCPGEWAPSVVIDLDPYIH